VSTSSKDSSFQELLSTVVHKDGHPIVLSKWGFHIEEIGGQNFLVSSSKEELEKYLNDNLEILNGEAVNLFLDRVEKCRIEAAGFCMSINCQNNNCIPRYQGGGWIICTCGL
jgi:hypothetical protein